MSPARPRFMKTSVAWFFRHDASIKADPVDGVRQFHVVAMEIPRCRGDVLVIHQDLNRPEVLAVGQQSRRESVTKHVRTDAVFADLGFPAVALDHLPDGARGHASIVSRDEQRPGPDSPFTDAHVPPQRRHKALTDRERLLFAAFSVQSHGLVFQRQVTHIRIGQFAQPRSRRENHGDDGVISDAKELGTPFLDHLEEPFVFLDRQERGLTSSPSRRRDHDRRVVPDQPHPIGKLEERPDC